MRCLLKVLIPVETGNAAISDGSLPKTIESILADLNPEAAYFAEENGKRTGFIFFDLKDTSQIPAVAEPWFLAFNAHIELHPAMNQRRPEESRIGHRKSSQELSPRRAGKSGITDITPQYPARNNQRSPSKEGFLVWLESTLQGRHQSVIVWRGHSYPRFLLFARTTELASWPPSIVLPFRP